MSRSEYNGQIRFGDPRPIRVPGRWTPRDIIFASAVVVMLVALGIAIWGCGVPGRIKDFMVTSMPIRWRRLKRLMGVRR
jgi:hypothetical protein